MAPRRRKDHKGRVRDGWEIDYVVDGQHKRKWLPHVTKTAARQIQAEIRTKILRGTYLDEVRQVLFRTWAAEFQESRRRTRSKKTQQNYHTVIAAVLPIIGHITVSNIRRRHIESWKQVQLTKVSPSTVNLQLMYLGRIFADAVQAGLCRDNPVKGIERITEDQSPAEYFTMDEVEQLMAAASQGHIRDLIGLAAHTGLRKGELIHLEWSDVDLERRVIQVTSKEHWKTKTRRSRDVPISPDALEILTSMPRYIDSGQLFRWHNKPIGNFDVTWRRTRDRAGVRRLPFHALRHTFASYLVMGGYDLRMVQAYLGHSSITVTERYAHLAPDYIQGSLDNYRPNDTHVSPVKKIDTDGGV